MSATYEYEFLRGNRHEVLVALQGLGQDGWRALDAPRIEDNFYTCWIERVTPVWITELAD